MYRLPLTPENRAPRANARYQTHGTQTIPCGFMRRSPMAKMVKSYLI